MYLGYGLLFLLQIKEVRKDLKIKKILNNNAVLVGENGNDFIWIGLGLGFQMKPGLEADETKIQKIFVLKEKSLYQRFEKLISSIPIEYFSLTNSIVQLAKKRLNYDFSEMLYISLTDHLFNLVKLYRQGIVLHNNLFWEIKKIYPEEFDIGKQALQLINKKINVSLEEEEACNIAMHLINARINEGNTPPVDSRMMAKKVHDIIAIIRLSNKLTISEDTIAYDRFVTHLRFFFQRLKNFTEDQTEPNSLLTYAKEQYQQAFKTMKLVEEYLGTTLNDDEQLYLTLHIQKLINNN